MSQKNNFTYGGLTPFYSKKCFSNFVPKTLFFVFATLIYSSNLMAQSSKSFEGILEADAQSKSELRELFTHFDVYSLNSSELKKHCSASETSVFDLKIGDKSLTINLIQNDIRSANYKQILGTDNGNVILPKGEITTYMGYTNDGAEVRMTINDGFIVGYFMYKNERFYLEPINRFVPGSKKDLYVWYNLKDVIPNPNATCGVKDMERQKENIDHDHEKEISEARNLLVPSGCVTIRLAIAVDNSYYVAYSSNTTAINNQTLSVTNNVISDYNTVFNKIINYTIVASFYSTTSTSAFETAITNSTDGSIILANFSTWAGSPTNVPANAFATVFDLASFWTKRDIASGGNPSLVGLAYTPGVCSLAAKNLLEDFTATASTLRQMVSHEYGHNWTCQHDVSGSPNIMAPSVNGSTTWSAASLGYVNSRESSADCNTLTYAIPGSPNATFNLATTECINYPTPLNDGAGRTPTSWTWSVTGGTVVSGTAQNTTATFTTAGNQTVTHSASNSACGSTQTNTVVKNINIINLVHPTATTSCSFNATNTGSSGGYGTGIFNVTLGSMNVSSSGTEGDGYVYLDKICGNNVSLSQLINPISVTVGTSNTERVRIYIDLNNNGTFTANESVFYGVGMGVLSGEIVIPSSVLRNTMLRMRVISDLNSNLPACTTPTYGQIEDYGIIVDNTCPTLSACSITNTNTGTSGIYNMGILNVTMGSINATSFATFEEGKVYVDRACNNTTTVSALTNTISITLGVTNNTQRVNVFIDYNNDGTFQSGEMVFAVPLQTTNTTGGNVLTGNFTIPNTATGNTKLLLRVVADFAGGPIPSACVTPTFGQVEDYSIIIPQALLLPVTLLRFDANEINKKVVLNWVTTNETNNKGFEIERSVDGKNYYSIGNIDGSGTTNATQQYTFVDERPIRGIAYYRLMQLDIDGKKEQIGTATVTVTGENLSAVFPNPMTNGKLNVIFKNEENLSDLTILISDLSGRILYNQTQNIVDGLNQFELDLETLPKGAYLMEIKRANSSEFIKLLK